jgi:hypothetical protein
VKIHQFTTDGFSGVKNFKYVCTEFLCCVCGLISVRLWLFVWVLICGLIQVISLSLLVNFQFFNICLPGTALGLDLFSGAYLYMLTVSVVLSDLE